MNETPSYADLGAMLDRLQVADPSGRGVFKVTHAQWQVLLRLLPRDTDTNPSWPSVAPPVGIPVQFVERVEDSTLHELGRTITLPDPITPNDGGPRVVLCAPDDQLMAEIATAGQIGVEIRVRHLIDPGTLVALGPNPLDVVARESLAHWHSMTLPEDAPEQQP